MARLFISYRRADTGAYADRLAARLELFQFEAIFQDREGIELGDNFADQIRSALSRCDAVLVLIGERWTAVDGTGQSRLADPADWVRREVALALSLGLPLIPVCFDSARVPAGATLPRELTALGTAQGYDINGNYFDRDADDLGRRLEQLLVARGRSSSERPAADVTANLLRQLRAIWMVLGAVTLALSIAPVFVRALPQFFWLFPGSMALAAFLWWLYWLGESLRPARSRLA